MKTLNKKYLDYADLEQFITLNKIHEEENLLLQIFSGITDTEFINSLLSSLRQLIPSIKIIGSSTCGEIFFDDVAEDSTILSFSMFENTKVYTYHSELKEDSYLTAQNIINQIDPKIKAKVGISFADGLLINGEEYT